MTKTARFALIFCLYATPLAAQSTDTTQAEPVFTHRDVYRAIGFVAGIAALAPLDKHLARSLQDSALQENSAFKRGAKFFKLMGQPAPQIIGVGLYGVGKLTHSTRAQKLAVHGLEAMLLSTAITGPLKLLAGRARPTSSTIRRRTISSFCAASRVKVVVPSAISSRFRPDTQRRLSRSLLRLPPKPASGSTRITPRLPLSSPSAR